MAFSSARALLLILFKSKQTTSTVVPSILSSLGQVYQYGSIASRNDQGWTNALISQVKDEQKLHNLDKKPIVDALEKEYHAENIVISPMVYSIECVKDTSHDPQMDVLFAVAFSLTERLDEFPQDWFKATPYMSSCKSTNCERHESIWFAQVLVSNDLPFTRFSVRIHRIRSSTRLFGRVWTHGNKPLPPKKVNKHMRIKTMFIERHSLANLFNRSFYSVMLLCTRSVTGQRHSKVLYSRWKENLLRLLALHCLYSIAIGKRISLNSKWWFKALTRKGENVSPERAALEFSFCDRQPPEMIGNTICLLCLLLLLPLCQSTGKISKSAFERVDPRQNPHP